MISSEDHHTDDTDSKSLLAGDENDEPSSSPPPSSVSSPSFLAFFLRSSGPPQVFFLTILYALAAGCTVGVVPPTMTTQYARINHGLDLLSDCTVGGNESSQECRDGNDDALTATAVASFASNMILFCTGSLVGSISDEVGRRRMLLTGMGLGLLVPLALVLIQLYPTMNPAWFYAASISSSFISYFTISLAALSDVIPPRWRASCFGLYMCGFAIGIALAPILAIPFSHIQVSLLSLGLVVFAYLYGLLFLPETLPTETSEQTRRCRREAAEREVTAMLLKYDGIILPIDEMDDPSREAQKTKHFYLRQRIQVSRLLFRPYRELLILNRSNIFRLLALLAFFSGISASGDQTLLLYYVEQRFQFNDTDVAYLFMLLGLLGILVFTFLLNGMTRCFGEKVVVVVAFIFGAITNSIYALASDKKGIFVGAAIGTVGMMAFPTISAIKSNNADEREQGQIQGALLAVSSLASALGPGLLRLGYQKTKDTEYPGAFFLIATTFYLVATVCAMTLPKEKANSK
eukprot:CAMPEP_0194307466 /NCGR_PEP_ID=MMETSP0171-20130528/4373_1 /TAXON_ID=218684 /ORGANISM="Corethron pennatum, Strain L29A3" /LENGTH=518 /DNA_ID=CAMNT_0039059557 /DNA_START=79 /DNA_END=1635 /DNA_ORIENTATION=+